MEQREYLYSGHAWFKERLNGEDGHLWKRARKLFLFNMDLSSALNIFRFDHNAIKTLSSSKGVTIIGSKNTDLDPNEPREHRPGHSWTDDAKNSIRILLDRIVTRWKPNYMYQHRINTEKLHHSLTPVSLQSVRETYDRTNNSVLPYDVKNALALYQACLVPLHYHELWSEIVSDFKNVVTTLSERETVIDTELFYDITTFDQEDESALIFGTNRVTFADEYKPLSKKLGLFDLVLIKVNSANYFGVIVHAEQVKVKIASEDDDHQLKSVDNTNDHHLKFDLLTTIGVYVSRTCSDSFQHYREQSNDKKLTITKLSNITSSRRMISAIHNLHEWSQHHSLLKPMINDVYFQFPEEYNSRRESNENGFNLSQSKVINIAECMFDELHERMHLIHGPPGTGKSRTIAGIVLKLLPKLSKLGRKQKILLCAPSNNACDELSRRILDEFGNQNVSYSRGTLVRIGCQPPDDHNLCDHFLDFMTLQDILMRHAKIVVSTLNYCGSARMHLLKSCTEFIIIDEACQSLEADLLLSLQFGCRKIMLVGDPQQLPPCVLSDAGKTYGLSQSLYGRLYSFFNKYPNSPITMLDTQYRMHPDICRFPSEYFYDNQLLTDQSVEERMRHFTLKSLYVYDITNSQHQYDGARSSFNEDEAKCIQKFCQRLIAYLATQSTPVSSDNEDEDESSTDSSSDSIHSNDDDDDDNVSIRDRDIRRRQLQPLLLNDPRSIKIQQRIAIITPYKAQVRLLSSYIPPYIEVMTWKYIGFLEDMNRLNVMLTRSKYALYIFGNLTHLSNQHDSWKELLEHVHGQRIISNVNVHNLEFELPYR
ncbi:hypothetical protein I4U23_008261 [Adineta vaga]|nr:hypothetical protein I4U23_008261 [Adineta vaga]